MAVDFKTVQSTVLRPIEVDRANASSNILIDETIARLKEIHGGYIRAHYEVWQLLATKICRECNPSSDPTSYDRAIQTGPDGTMIHLFASTYETADDNLENVRQNVSIGRSINNNVASASKISIQRMINRVASSMTMFNSIQNSFSETDFCVCLK